MEIEFGFLFFERILSEPTCDPRCIRSMEEFCSQYVNKSFIRSLRASADLGHAELPSDSRKVLGTSWSLLSLGTRSTLPGAHVFKQTEGPSPLSQAQTDPPLEPANGNVVANGGLSLRYRNAGNAPGNQPARREQRSAYSSSLSNGVHSRTRSRNPAGAAVSSYNIRASAAGPRRTPSASTRTVRRKRPLPHLTISPIRRMWLPFVTVIPFTATAPAAQRRAPRERLLTRRANQSHWSSRSAVQASFSSRSLAKGCPSPAGARRRLPLSIARRRRASARRSPPPARSLRGSRAPRAARATPRARRRLSPRARARARRGRGARDARRGGKPLQPIRAQREPGEDTKSDRGIE